MLLMNFFFLPDYVRKREKEKERVGRVGGRDRKEKGKGRGDTAKLKRQ